MYEAVYLAATFAAGPGEVVPLVATWQGALRDLQIHGFALLMILGRQPATVACTTSRLPGPGPGSCALACLVGLNLAVAGEATGLVLMRLAGHAWAGLWYASVLLLTGCVDRPVVNWRVFGRAAGPDRSLKFVRAAYAWLLVSLAMLVLLPAYQFAVLPASPGQRGRQDGVLPRLLRGDPSRHHSRVRQPDDHGRGRQGCPRPERRSDPRRLTRLWVPFLLAQRRRAACGWSARRPPTGSTGCSPWPG